MSDASGGWQRQTNASVGQTNAAEADKCGLGHAFVCHSAGQMRDAQTNESGVGTNAWVSISSQSSSRVQVED
jgi:hypothetical protein